MSITWVRIGMNHSKQYMGEKRYTPIKEWYMEIPERRTNKVLYQYMDANLIS